MRKFRTLKEARAYIREQARRPTVDNAGLEAHYLKKGIVFKYVVCDAFDWRLWTVEGWR
jgi:hypothetical protein